MNVLLLRLQRNRVHFCNRKGAWHLCEGKWSKLYFRLNVVSYRVVIVGGFGLNCYFFALTDGLSLWEVYKHLVIFFGGVGLRESMLVTSM